MCLIKRLFRFDTFALYSNYVPLELFNFTVKGFQTCIANYPSKSDLKYSNQKLLKIILCCIVPFHVRITFKSQMENTYNFRAKKPEKKLKILLLKSTRNHTFELTFSIIRIEIQRFKCSTMVQKITNGTHESVTYIFSWKCVLLIPRIAHIRFSRNLSFLWNLTQVSESERSE